MERLLRTCLALVLVGVGGCGQTENPACVEADPEVVELDADLGGFTVESLAQGRSGPGRMTDSDRLMGFTIETTAIGPALVQRWANCGGGLVSLDTPVEIELRSDDGSIDIVVDGSLRSELGGPALLEVSMLELTDVDGFLPLADVGATGEAIGVGIDVAGIDGRGSMWWIATGPAAKVPFAELELPYSVDESDFGP